MTTLGLRSHPSWAAAAIAAVLLGLAIAQTIVAVRAGDWLGCVIGTAVALAVGAISTALVTRRVAAADRSRVERAAPISAAPAPSADAAHRPSTGASPGTFLRSYRDALPLARLRIAELEAADRATDAAIVAAAIDGWTHAVIAKHDRAMIAAAQAFHAALAAVREPPAVRRVIAIVDIFVAHAREFEHPLARQFISQWDQLVEALRASGEEREDVAESLLLVEQTGVFTDTIAREWSTYEPRFVAALDALSTAAVPRFDRLDRTIAHLADAGALPPVFVTASADLVVACGSSSASDRLAAAHRLVATAPALPRELAWLGRIGSRAVLAATA
jgi:hypothetical protein